MRIIPKKIKVKNTDWKCYSMKYILVALVVFAIVFFAIDVVERSNRYEEDKKKVKEKNEEHFKDAENIPTLSTDKMFNDAFDVNYDQSTVNLEETEEIFFTMLCCFMPNINVNCL